MKRLTLLFTLPAGSALAHGGHAPVPEVAHGLAHMTPVAAGIAAIVAALAVAWIRRTRQ